MMMNRSFQSMGTALIAGAALLTTCTPAAADCGSVPFLSPLDGVMDVVMVEDSSPSVKIDPTEVTVFEPKQRAMIAWNGEEQVLLLSTDQSVNAPHYSVLEVIPFPSEPRVALGQFDTFERAQRIVVEKRLWAVAHGGAPAGAITLPEAAGRIAFQKKMGAHDLAVAECLDPGAFEAFVKQLLHDKYGVQDAAIRPEFLRIIENYARDGYTWFAFDRIELSDKAQSRQPIEYRFKSDRIFYPLRISALEGGVTDVELLVLSATAPTRFEGIAASRFERQPALTITRDELAAIESRWLTLFPKDTATLHLNQWSLSGPTSSFPADVLVK